MLDTITQTACSVLNCRFAWLLTFEEQENVLKTASVACDTDDMEQNFRRTIALHYPGGQFPARFGDNPIAEVFLRNTSLVGLDVTKLANIDGGEPLMLTLSTLQLNSVTLVALRQSDHLRGVLVIADGTNTRMASEEGQHLVKALRRLATLELDYLALQEELEQAEARRQAERNFYQVVLNTIGDGLVITDAEGKITYASQRLLMMTGRNSQDLLGSAFVDLIDAESRRHFDTVFQKSPDSSIRLEIRQQDGSLIPVLMTRVVTRDIVGQGNSAVIVLSDLSNLQEQEKSLQRQTRRLEAVNRASRAISARIDIEAVIREILTSAHEVLNAVVTCIGLQDTDEALVIVATHGSQAMHGRVIPVGKGIIGWVAAHAEPVLVSDVSEDARFNEELDDDPGLETRSMVAVPLIASNEVIGVLAAINRERGVFEDGDRATLQSLGASAAVAIENAMLFEQTHNRLTELSTLLDASAALASTRDLRSILEQITRRLREALGVGRVVVATVDQRLSQMSMVASVVDAAWDRVSAPRFALVAGSPKRAALTQANSVSLGSINSEWPDYYELLMRGARYVLNVPLRGGDKIEGVISIYGQDAMKPAQAAAVEKAAAGWHDASDDPWDDLTILCHRTLQAANALWCAVYQYDSATSALYLRRETGVASWEEHAAPLINLADFLTLKETIIGGEARTVSRAAVTSKMEERYFDQLGVSTALMVQLSMQDQPAGLVQALATTSNSFDDSAFSLVEGIANVISSALKSAALYSSVEKRAEALEAAYREIEEADRLKDELIQNLSHELGTPLTHVLGYLSLLEEGAFGSLQLEQKNTIHMIVEKAGRMAELVKHMVAMHSGDVHHLNLKATRLDQLAALAVRSMTARARAAGIEIVANFPANLPLVRVDQVAMSEVFEALLDNAIKFSRGGRRVEITIHDFQGPTLQVTIRDQGIGIPPQEYDKVFKQFYQVDQGTTRKFGGMGLGLAIVRKIIQAHSGRVWIESEVDKGTTIHFTVPKLDLSASTGATGRLAKTT